VNGAAANSISQRIVDDRRSAHLNLAVNVFSYAILLGGAATIFLTIYLIFVSYSCLPHWDGWSQIDFGANEGTPFALDWLWRQQNQHRLVLPKMFLLADLRWFRATQVFLLASIFAIQLLHLVLLSWSMRVFGGWRGALWRTGIGLAAFCLFCPSQWENFTWGFQTCFVLPALFATLSFIGLLLYWTRSGREFSRRGSWKYLLLSIAAALGATYSLSNGNLLWPLLLTAALLLRVRLAAIVSYAVAGVASTALYLNNYTVYPTVMSSARTPIAVFKYLAVYFGSTWVPSGLRAAEIIGLAGFVVVLFLLVSLPTYIRNCRLLPIQLVLTLLFCLGTGLITALGRLVFGIAQAFASRYQTIALLFWCCLGLILLEIVSLLRDVRDRALLLSQTVLLAGMLVAACLAQTPLISARLHGFEINAAAMALVTGVPDSAQLQWADSHPDYPRSLVPYLRSERLSVFSEPEPSYLGQPLDSVFGLASADDCLGKVESSTVITSTWPRSLRITGWAWDSEDRRPPAKIAVTSDGVITGLGTVGGWRPKQETNNARMTSCAAPIGEIGVPHRNP